uniref:translation initiation factor IF-2-like n=1 Tax=Nyctereutes procyonoides TaxID=34880 RepID=UPI002443987C|nr:translation initiation factor IF-2-like [Nyctereutes procyonoides]
MAPVRPPRARLAAACQPSPPPPPPPSGRARGGREEGAPALGDPRPPPPGRARPRAPGTQAAAGGAPGSPRAPARPRGLSQRGPPPQPPLAGRPARAPGRRAQLKQRPGEPDRSRERTVLTPAGCLPARNGGLCSRLSVFVPRLCHRTAGRGLAKREAQEARPLELGGSPVRSDCLSLQEPAETQAWPVDPHPSHMPPACRLAALPASRRSQQGVSWGQGAFWTPPAPWPSTCCLPPTDPQTSAHHPQHVACHPGLRAAEDFPLTAPAWAEAADPERGAPLGGAPHAAHAAHRLAQRSRAGAGATAGREQQSGRTSWRHQLASRRKGKRKQARGAEANRGAEGSDPSCRGRPPAGRAGDGFSAPRQQAGSDTPRQGGGTARLQRRRRPHRPQPRVPQPRGPQGGGCVAQGCHLVAAPHRAAAALPPAKTLGSLQAGQPLPPDSPPPIARRVGGASPEPPPVREQQLTREPGPRGNP